MKSSPIVITRIAADDARRDRDLRGHAFMAIADLPQPYAVGLGRTETESLERLIESLDVATATIALARVQAVVELAKEKRKRA